MSVEMRRQLLSTSFPFPLWNQGITGFRLTKQVFLPTKLSHQPHLCGLKNKWTMGKKLAKRSKRPFYLWCPASHACSPLSTYSNCILTGVLHVPEEHVLRSCLSLQVTVFISWASSLLWGARLLTNYRKVTTLQIA